MKLLISAYACRPDMGSEPAVGWSWVSELCKYHELCVLTNYTNKPYIEDFLQHNPHCMENVIFTYVRPNPNLTFWYKEWKRFERVYYYLWQHKALKIATELHKKEHFACVQHVTYVTCVMPTYMHKLGIPFIYGPISGGEHIPKVINYPMSVKEHLVEDIRTLTQIIPKISINTYKAYKSACKIITVTDDTTELIPAKFKDKIEVMQAIGMNDDYFSPEPSYQPHSTCRILIAGRLLYWKGFELGILAAVKALDKGSNITLTVLGAGSESSLQKLRMIAGKYCDKEIIFIQSVKYEEMKNFYEQFDLLLNCSLRDSGCLVVMEAMSRGLPIICVDTGGPKVNTDSKCALKIEPKEFGIMVEEIATAIYKMADSPELRMRMSHFAYETAKMNFRNSVKIKKFLHVYDDLEKKG